MLTSQPTRREVSVLCANALEDRQWLAGVVGKVHRSQTPDELCFALTPSVIETRSEHVLR